MFHHNSLYMWGLNSKPYSLTKLGGLIFFFCLFVQQAITECEVYSWRTCLVCVQEQGVPVTLSCFLL
jgi:hypothetical protein